MSFTHSFPNPRDEELLNKLQPALEFLYRHYFRCKTTGWNNISDTQTLFVGNHNGIIAFDSIMLFHAWNKRFGSNKSPLALTHDFILKHPVFGKITQAMGGISANFDTATAAARAGHSLLVYPGGGKEAFRPWIERNSVDFHGRTGWVRVAIEQGLSVSPVVSCGGQETYLIFDRGERLAQKLGINKKYRIDGLPITPGTLLIAALTAVGAVSFFPLFLLPTATLAALVPLPAKMSFHFMKPIDCKKIWRSTNSKSENHQRIYDHVITRMRACHNQMYSKRKLPIVG